MSQNSLLDGRRVLLTGGARGLGYAFAEAAARAGARVVIADILEERVQRSARELAEQGLDISGLPLDLADPVSIERCVAAAVERLGGLDGLVNNASITNSGGKSCEELEIEVFDRVLQVNVRGTWLMTRACLPALRESGRGAVVNLASDTPLWGAPNLLAYSASKGALIAMTRSLAASWAATASPSTPSLPDWWRSRPPSTCRPPATGSTASSARSSAANSRRMSAARCCSPFPTFPASSLDKPCRSTAGSSCPDPEDSMTDLNQNAPKSWDRPEGASFEEWCNTRIARYSTRKYDWNALKFQADYDPRFRRAQMRYIGTGGTGVASDMNTIPSEHFTFSTMVIPAGHEGPPHLHIDVEEVFFVLRGKLKVVLEKDGERFETILTDRDVISVPPACTARRSTSATRMR
ncbi:short-chain dehydrogenase [Pseudomonas aeruginosa]|nr:short-chain dehydrogenase [Pseudomonas aeruginosa]